MSVFGNADADVADCFKVFIQGKDDMVVGLIGEGTSMELVSNWNSPFEGDSLGGLFEKVGGAIQIMTGLTSLTSIASHQVWEGNEPYLFNLALKFYALKDPSEEVESAIKALEKMMAPDVNKWNPKGRIPPSVMLDIGRKRIYPECVLTNMSVPLDKERDKQGNLIRCEVSLQVETLEMVTAQKLK